MQNRHTSVPANETRANDVNGNSHRIKRNGEMMK
jgi:hypothetical protein